MYGAKNAVSVGLPLLDQQVPTVSGTVWTVSVPTAVELVHSAKQSGNLCEMRRGRKYSDYVHNSWIV